MLRRQSKCSFKLFNEVIGNVYNRWMQYINEQ